jgi:hypothetical protein
MFKREQWSDEASEGLGSSLGNDADAIRGQVESGEAALYYSRAANSWMVTRIEGRELVICCYAGRGARAAFRAVMARARAEGMTSVRFHTRHAWLIELVADWQPEAVEYVLRVAVRA